MVAKELQKRLKREEKKTSGKNSRRAEEYGRGKKGINRSEEKLKYGGGKQGSKRNRDGDRYGRWYQFHCWVSELMQTVKC